MSLVADTAKDRVADIILTVEIVQCENRIITTSIHMPGDGIPVDAPYRILPGALIVVIRHIFFLRPIHPEYILHTVHTFLRLEG